MKKLLLVAGVVGAIAFYLNKKTAEPQNELEETDDVVVFRELNDAEAKNYLNQNSDLVQAFGNDLEKAKWHWRIQGFPIEFVNGKRQNPYLT